MVFSFENRIGRKMLGEKRMHLAVGKQNNQDLPIFCQPFFCQTITEKTECSGPDLTIAPPSRLDAITGPLSRGVIKCVNAASCSIDDH